MCYQCVSACAVHIRSDDDASTLDVVARISLGLAPGDLDWAKVSVLAHSYRLEVWLELLQNDVDGLDLSCHQIDFAKAVIYKSIFELSSSGCIPAFLDVHCVSFGTRHVTFAACVAARVGAVEINVMSSPLQYPCVSMACKQHHVARVMHINTWLRL